MKILIAEDDIDIVELLKLYLENEGYEIFTSGNGQDAYQIFLREEINLCLLDIMMPSLNGYDLAKKIREISHVPIIFLTAKNSDADVVRGLNMGADDYITKPFSPKQLVARVHSTLRRSYEMNIPEAIIRYRDLSLDTQQFKLYKNNEEILLTLTEYKILKVLLSNPGHIYTKAQLYENINGNYLENDDNTIMVHISKLRDKIEKDPRNPQYIVTIRGIGYKVEKE